MGKINRARFFFVKHVGNIKQKRIERNMYTGSERAMPETSSNGGEIRIVRLAINATSLDVK
jgi:hypothetical protein